ncbi:FAD synthase [Mycoplasmopsis primatum]|uniref:FAD synthase n=1 Tax=Mycoplasmopsis primatum TaxID=55604 RepID=UPI00049861C6|nr:hypothetical protein [Mycoplasmopsis primatum]
MSFNIYSLDKLPKFNQPIYLIGVFESFHLGHNSLLQKANELQNNTNRDIVIVFFKDVENMPKTRNGYIFSDFENRIQELANLGFTNGIYLEFEKIKNYEPDLFLDKLLNNQDKKDINIIIGEDFRFGEKARGNKQTLIKKIGAENVFVAPTLTIGDNIKISTTFIKECVELGDIELVNSLNLYMFSFFALISKHDGIATLKVNNNLVPLKTGIYLVFAEINEMTYYGILKTNINEMEIKFIDFELNDTKDLKARIKTIKSIRFVNSNIDDEINENDFLSAKKFLLNNKNKLW